VKLICCPFVYSPVCSSVHLSDCPFICRPFHNCNLKFCWYVNLKSTLCTQLKSTFFVLTIIFWAKFGSVYSKFTIRFRMLIRRILSMIMKTWVQPLFWPVGRGRCGHSLFFVLEGKETNKSFKDTMSLNGIDRKVSRWEFEPCDWTFFQTLLTLVGSLNLF
jgi:hypothetical protein